jgi:tetratricopeptide (TPR) repeat protein
VSARARTALIVAALAAAAALAVAAGAVLTADEREGGTEAAAQPQPREGSPPLVLDLGLRQDEEAADLRRGAELYAAGRRDEAARLFGRYESLEAKLGVAFADWPESADRVEQIGALYPRSALVQLHVGLARFWAGTGGALSAWREARDVEPDTPYAVYAADYLYARDFAPGLPAFTPSFDNDLEGASLAESFARLRADGTVRGRLLFGVVLQRLGRPVSARRAFAEAARLAPDNVDALVADAVGRYEKNNPSGAFSRLGPLSRRFPQSASVRFHLGLLLLWQKDVEGATRQLELARRAEPGSKIAREAARFLDAIRNAGTD